MKWVAEIHLRGARGPLAARPPSRKLKKKNPPVGGAATQSRSFTAASEIRVVWPGNESGRTTRRPAPLVVGGVAEKRKEMESGGSQAGRATCAVVLCRSGWLAGVRRFLEAGSTQGEGDRWRKDADASHGAPALVPACAFVCG